MCDGSMVGRARGRIAKLKIKMGTDRSPGKKNHLGFWSYNVEMHLLCEFRRILSRKSKWGWDIWTNQPTHGQTMLLMGRASAARALQK